MHSETIFDLAEKHKRIADIEKLMSADDFWNDSKQATSISKESADLRTAVAEYNDLRSKLDDCSTLLELLGESGVTGPDPEGKPTDWSELETQITQLSSELSQIEINALLSGAHDRGDCTVAINSGQGGTESCDWADMLARMYLRWCERKGFKTSIIDETPGEEAGVSSITILVEGRFAYGYLKTETGVHRLVRISPFDANKRRHTSFASVEVMPVLPDSELPEIPPDDIEFSAYRSSSAGGQNVNKVSSAVRIKHIPTGIVVNCQTERSQLQNKQNAMRMLASKLMEQMLLQKKAEISDLKGEEKQIGWGSQIRSYVFQPYQMVKDLRTGAEVGNVQAVMDGDLDTFIWAMLRGETRD